jgi:hypothetical protein
MIIKQVKSLHNKINIYNLSDYESIDGYFWQEYLTDNDFRKYYQYTKNDNSIKIKEKNINIIHQIRKIIRQKKVKNILK